MRNLVLLFLSLILLTACKTGTKKESNQPIKEYSVVGTWELIFTENIDGADTTLDFSNESEIIIRKVVAANNTFNYSIMPKENEYDLELNIRGDYKIEGDLYYEYMSNDTDMDQLMIELIGSTSKIYKTKMLDDSRWVLEVMNLGDINQKLTQYWKRL
jgi:hypothetical protein